MAIDSSYKQSYEPIANSSLGPSTPLPRCEQSSCESHDRNEVLGLCGGALSVRQLLGGLDDLICLKVMLYADT
jgi:hypothetical protein